MVTKSYPKTAFYINLALICISILLTLALCEVVVRIFIPVRSVGPSFTIYDPVYVKSNKRSFTCIRIAPEFTIQFTTNSLGFRGPEPEVFPYRPILFLGDSFTLGYGVNDGEEFPELIRKILVRNYGKNQVPVINAGLYNNGNGRWVKFLRNEGKRFNPRMIVLQLCGNDFEDNVNERLFNLTSSGDLVELTVGPPSKVRMIKKLIEAIPHLPYSRLVGLARQLPGVRDINRNSNLPNSENKMSSKSAAGYKEQLTFRLVTEVLRICEHEGWPVLMIFVPTKKGQPLVGLETILRRSSIPLIKVPSKNERPNLYYLVDGHWNASGHAFVADLIADELLSGSIFDLQVSSEQTHARYAH